ncbi:Ribosome biogenesis protein erb1 [Tulasnella sp. 418]|nr:Ribosome biogenesis protein erb1 [Tulasnella sp. 418]
MAPLAVRRDHPSGKRKLKEITQDNTDINSAEDDDIHHKLGLEMPSDSDEEEGSEDEGSDEDEFPEIDDESEPGSGESEGSDQTEEDEEEGESAPTSEDDADLGPDVDKKQLPSEAPLPGVYPKPKIIKSDITGKPKRVYPEIEPEYDSDSSTEDDPNRVGNIPMHWYDDLPHIGYNIDGKQVLRPAKGDELDKFLATVEDPKSWTSGFDHSTQAETQLTAEELDIIRRLQAAEVPDGSYNPYEPTVEWFTGKGKEEVMPLSSAPEPKRRWQPSKWEKQKVMKIVRAIRQGRIVPNKPKATKPQFYALWSTPASDHPPPLSAPKVRLPTNAESYNPPEEYLPDEEEKKEWEETEKEDRARNFLPKKYPALRLVPAYDQFIQERFERLLDLYLAPRVQRKRLNIDPESLLPSLPSPQSLKPFPVFEGLRMGDQQRRFRCLSVSPDGLWIAAGDEAGIVRVYETALGREAARWDLKTKIGAIEWCPKLDVCFFLVGVEDIVYAFMPPDLPAGVQLATHTLLNPRELPQPVKSATATVKWLGAAASERASSSMLNPPLLTIEMPTSKSGLPRQIAFHKKGDYFATVASGEGQSALWIHQLSKRHSQSPFKKVKGSVQRVLFHPSKPHFFVATQRYVRIYDLAAQSLLKTLLSGIRWISSMDIHPSGDHLLVGGYDKKLCWFDLELSDKPYKVLKYHSRAIRSVAFSPTYPLFASSSDDGTIQIFHARVFSDWNTDPLIVPLKVLKGHEIRDGLGVLEIKWAAGLGTCWLVSAGADGQIRVWCN